MSGGSAMKSFCASCGMTASSQYSKEKPADHVNGKSLVSGSNNMRKGITVRQDAERADYNIGRAVSKSVAENCLLIMGGTEYE